MMMWRSYYDYLAVFKPFLLKTLCLKLPVGIAQFHYIIQRKFQKIQRKMSKVSIFPFEAIKPIHKLFYGIILHSWGYNATFDTHIAISRHDICQMPYVSFMSKMPKMPYFRHMAFDVCHIQIWQYGCQKMRKDLWFADQWQ